MNILFNPIKNVLSAPKPSIGKRFSGTKYLAIANSIISMLKKTIGVIMRLTCEIGLTPNFTAKTTGIKNNSNRNTIELFSK